MSDLADIDWNTRDVGEFTTSIGDYYLRKAGNATPRKLLPLLDFLDAMTDEAEKGVGDSGESQKQIENDIAGWRKRSSNYRIQLVAAAKVDPDKGTMIADNVIGPLLMGWYPGEKERRGADVTTPHKIAHGIALGTDAMEHAWASFGDDLAKATKDATSGAAAATEKAFKGAEWAFDPEHRGRLVAIGAGVLVLALGTAVAVAKLTAPRVTIKDAR